MFDKPTRICFLMILLAAFQFSCSDSGSPGSFSVEFKWLDDPPEAESWVKASIEKREEIGVSGEIIADSGAPVLLENDVELHFSEVPYDIELVVAVEILDSNKQDAHVLYFGHSEFFKVTAGKHTTVAVALNLLSTPNADIADDIEGAISVVEARAGAGFLNVTEVTLSLAANRAVTAIIANDSALVDARREVSLENLKQEDDGRYLVESWNLNTGRSDKGDGKREVFVRYSNESGYESPIYSTEVIVDRVLPGLESEVGIDPPLANAASLVTLSVKSDEALRSAPEIYVDPPDFGFSPTDQGDGGEYRFIYVVDGRAVDGRSYRLSADLTDLAGNVAKDVDLGISLTTDLSVPEALALTIGDGETEKEAFSAMEGHNEMLLRFEPSETLATSDGAALVLQTDSSEVSVGCSLKESYIECEYDVQGNEGEGQRSLTLFLRDLAGNEAEYSYSTVFDFSAPTIIDGSLEIELVPAAENILSEVSAVADGTSINVRFAVDEPPATVVLAVNNAIENVVFQQQPVRESETEIIFSAIASGLADDLQYAERILLTALSDTLGNGIAANRELGMFDIDTVIPAGPDTEHEYAIVYSSYPWGADFSDGAAGYSLSGAPGAVEGSGTIIVFDSLGEVELGRGMSISDGSFSDLSITGGHSQVSLLFADLAGNASNLEMVRNVEWIATMGGKVPGSSQENPHELESFALFPLDGERKAAVNIGEPAIVALNDEQSFQTSGAGLWTEIGEFGPAPRRHHQLVYETGNERFLLFGGDAQGCGEGENGCSYTWIGDGQSWQVASVEGPEARTDHTMVYDPQRGQVLLFGGKSRAVEGVCADGGSPAEDGWCMLGDSWIWDGESWSRMEVEGPTARHAHSMVYDSYYGHIILFGGYNPAGCDRIDSNYCGDTWSWNGGSWQLVAENGPEPRRYSAMAFDATRQRSLLFGGESDHCEDGYCEGSWEWNGSNWFRSEGEAPAGRQSHVMVYDPLRKHVWMTGGTRSVGEDCLEGEGRYCAHTWEWTNGGWRLITKDGPFARTGAAAAFDPVMAGVLMFGGQRQPYCDDQSSGYCTNAWFYDAAATKRSGQSFIVSVDEEFFDDFVSIEEISTEWVSGGIGSSADCLERGGAILYIWEGSDWKALVTNNAPTEDPEPLFWSTSIDPLWYELGQQDFKDKLDLLWGENGSLQFAIIPLAANGCAMNYGSVATDYVETRIRVRHIGD